MVHNLVEVGFEVGGEQHGLQAPGGDATPVKVLHPEGPPELQLGAMQQVSLPHHGGLPIPCCCPDSRGTRVRNEGVRTLSPLLKRCMEQELRPGWHSY